MAIDLNTLKGGTIDHATCTQNRSTAADSEQTNSSSTTLPEQSRAQRKHPLSCTDHSHPG